MSHIIPTLDGKGKVISKKERIRLRHLKSAIFKSRRYHKRIWVGYLTPSEILALLESGAKINSPSYAEEHAKERKEKGECSSVWFYFFPDGIDMTKYA
jgi:hypothetical protein